MILPKLTPQDDPGLRRLAKAVVRQALEDLTLGDPHSCQAAWDWLHSRHSEGLTFESCCSIIGSQPDDLRRRLLTAWSYPEPPAEFAAGATGLDRTEGYQLAS